jgi:hypothetical protein
MQFYSLEKRGMIILGIAIGTWEQIFFGEASACAYY